MTTVSFEAQLTVVSNWLTNGHQSCCWNGYAKPFNFLSELLKCCWLCAVHRVLHVTPQESQVGLNLAIVGVTQQMLCVLSISREKCCQNRPWHHDGNLGGASSCWYHMSLSPNRWRTAGKMDYWGMLRYAAPLTVPSKTNGSPFCVSESWEKILRCHLLSVDHTRFPS
jgi:hypothetical protein